MVAACRVPDVPRITAALSVSIGLQIPRPSSVDFSRVVDATCIVQIKVGKVPFVGTFHHTILTICHQQMPCIGPCLVTTSDKICPVRSSGSTS
ncbi:hypothetical protein DPMN_148822 [Dreissena polymorpha]|uniref:Uncharacterized protein n=1 Tax=Dreissena polymorpha TaxID=45954 RepID=A0A9D4J4D7_DREPO|nr:hypothetical protein DPMN_148822 [Dreissena polymorpha]